MESLEGRVANKFMNITKVSTNHTMIGTWNTRNVFALGKLDKILMEIVRPECKCPGSK